MKSPPPPLTSMHAFIGKQGREGVEEERRGGEEMVRQRGKWMRRHEFSFTRSKFHSNHTREGRAKRERGKKRGGEEDGEDKEKEEGEGKCAMTS